MDFGPKPPEDKLVDQLPSLDLPQHSTHAPKDHKGLAIVLVVAVVFLLAAIGVAAWLFMQKSGGNTVITQLDPNSTSNVKTLSWVEPEMPSGYQKYNQSTTSASVTYYANTSEGCSVTTRLIYNNDISDLAEVAAKANDSDGIETTTLAGSLTASIKDSDGQREYDFEGTEFDQKVSVPTLDYSAQSGVVYYKQFGSNLATVSFVCKVATFEVNAEDLIALVKQFTVKTER